MKTIKEMREEAVRLGVKSIEATEQASRLGGGKDAFAFKILAIEATLSSTMLGVAAEICERLENLQESLENPTGIPDVQRTPPNLDAAARLAGAWATVYSAAVGEINATCLDMRKEGPNKNYMAFERNLAIQADKAFAELCKISEFMTNPIAEGKENGDD